MCRELGRVRVAQPGYAVKHLITCSILFFVVACDNIGDASPECQMQIVGAQPNTPAGLRPWVALWITGHTSCLDGVADNLRVSMFDTSADSYYHGDAELTSAKTIGNTTVCAVYKWPAWESGTENWSIIVAPPPRTSGDDDPPSAIGLVPSQIDDLDSSSSLPFWLVGDAFRPYLESPMNTANCWPGSGA